jgi:PPOX class probable F420-dependent enzyme
MMTELSDADRELLTGRHHAHFVTLNPDGTPQATPLWVDASEDGHVLVNTAVGRVKDRNVRRDPRVAVSVQALDEPYRWVSVTGMVVEMITGDQAEAHIDALARRYDGTPWTPCEGQVRVMYRIRPDRVIRSG